jgi:RimJ/RimL family protein N-acetyltransferase
MAAPGGSIGVEIMDKQQQNLFQGKLVRLAMANPEEMATAFSAWDRNSEFLRMLHRAPAQLWSTQKMKSWMEQEQDNEPDECFLAIRSLADDRLIGTIGFFKISMHHSEAWVAIGIGGEDNWGKGYGSDAMQVMLRYAFYEWNLHRVTLGVFEYNTRAIRCYEKMGFRYEGRVRQSALRDGRRWDLIHMGILKDEWIQSMGKEYADVRS